MFPSGYLTKSSLPLLCQIIFIFPPKKLSQAHSPIISYAFPLLIQKTPENFCHCTKNKPTSPFPPATSHTIHHIIYYYIFCCFPGVGMAIISLVCSQDIIERKFYIYREKNIIKIFIGCCILEGKRNKTWDHDRNEEKEEKTRGMDKNWKGTRKWGIGEEKGRRRQLSGRQNFVSVPIDGFSNLPRPNLESTGRRSPGKKGWL